MPRMSASLTDCGASKLTSPWSSRKGRSTEYIMSRMRMMPEKGTSSRYLAIAIDVKAKGRRPRAKVRNALSFLLSFGQNDTRRSPEQMTSHPKIAAPDHEVLDLI